MEAALEDRRTLAGASVSTIRKSASSVARVASQPPVSRAELEEFFAGVTSSLRQADGVPSHAISQLELESFFRGFARKHAASEKARLRRNRTLASGFNVFDYIEPDENKVSDVLADLLNPKGDHGQGDLFLRLLFKQLGLVVDAKHTEQATVRREAATHNILNSRRRMDILVEAGVTLAIENKIDSAEQPKQVKEYLEHLHHHTCDRSARAALIYLSPNGRPPESASASAMETLTASGKLHCWSYQAELRGWLESCREKCAAPKVRNFLADLTDYIQRKFQREPVSTPEVEDYEK